MLDQLERNVLKGFRFIGFELVATVEKSSSLWNLSLKGIADRESPVAIEFTIAFVVEPFEAQISPIRIETNEGGDIRIEINATQPKTG